MIANVTFCVFIDNYPTSAFDHGVGGGSAAMLVIGAALAFSSTFLVEPAQERFDEQTTVRARLLVMLVCALAFVASPIAWLSLVPVFGFHVFFGVSYPTLLAILLGRGR
jgi:DHA1 family tetracycline resistance protein-like MFS transporter